MELPNTQAYTYGIHTHPKGGEKGKERKKRKREGDGFRGVEERGY